MKVSGKEESSAGILEQSMGLGTEYSKMDCRTGPPGYIGWRNRFLCVPEKFQNAISVEGPRKGGEQSKARMKEESS